MTGHQWTKYKYNWLKRRWYRHCVAGGRRTCTAIESVARGMRPKGQ